MLLKNLIRYNLIKSFYLPTRCYDRDSYPSSSHDEFIVPVSSGGSLLAAYPDDSVLPGSKGLPTIAGESMEAVKFVVEEYNRREDDSEYYKLVQVHEASAQVRVKYYFYLQLFLCILRKKFTLVREW